MDSTSQNSDNTMSTVEAVSVAIDNLTLLTNSFNERSLTSKNSETETVEVLLKQSDVNFNEICASDSPLITRNRTSIRPVVLSDSRVPENFNPTKDGLSCVISTSVVPRDMRIALRDSIHDKVKIDYVIRQNDHSNPHQNSPRMLRSNSLDCVVTLYDSESEDSDLSFYSEDDSSDQDSELEYLGSFPAQKSDDESLHSDGESIESSEDLNESDNDSNSSDEDPNDSDDEPCTTDEELSDDSPEHSDNDTSTSSDDDKPDPSDEDSEDDGSSSTNDEESSDHDDEEESSDDDKSIDLENSSESSSESSDNSE